MITLVTTDKLAEDERWVLTNGEGKYHNRCPHCHRINRSGLWMSVNRMYGNPHANNPPACKRCSEKMTL